MKLNLLAKLSWLSVDDPQNNSYYEATLMPHGRSSRRLVLRLGFARRPTTTTEDAPEDEDGDTYFRRGVVK